MVDAQITTDDIPDLIERAEEHYRRSRLTESAADYDTVLALDPDNLDALEWRGEIAVQLDDYETAADRLGAARRIRGDDAFGEYTNLGLALYELNRADEAVDALWRAIQQDADDLVSHSNLGKALYDQHANGERETAIRIAAEWLSRFPDNPDAQHIGAAISGGTTPNVANSAYVADVFNDYAASFEEKLAELAYRAPVLIEALLTRHMIGAEGGLSILDAGCGTGLLGQCLRPIASRLEGVDLSPGMLKEAEAKSCYDTLAEAELVSFLCERPGRYDLIAAADVLCYFGALEDAAAAFYTALKPTGTLAFSVEATETESYILNESGRYKHSAAYLRHVVEEAGFSILALDDDSLRTEYGVPVEGLILLAQRD